MREFAWEVMSSLLSLILYAHELIYSKYVWFVNSKYVCVGKTCYLKMPSDYVGYNLVYAHVLYVVVGLHSIMLYYVPHTILHLLILVIFICCKCLRICKVKGEC